MMSLVVSGISSRQGLADSGVGGGVHGGGGVVQNENPGFFQQGPGDAQPLLLPAGDIGAALLNVGLIPVRKALDEFVGAGQAAGVPTALRLGGLGIAPAEVVPAMVPEKRTFFCRTIATWSRQDLQIILANILCRPPSLRPAWRRTAGESAAPESTWHEPVPPRIPTVMPERMWRVTPSRASRLASLE